MHENQKNSENEDDKSTSDNGNEKDKNKKKCVRIIERLKFIFDQFRNNYDKNVKNLAISIDKYAMKRKIDIRVDIKLVTKKIKENVTLNAQRNKDIKNTLEEIKYKIKGYSAKKEIKEEIILLNEENKIKGRKIDFNEEIKDKDNHILFNNEKEKFIEINGDNGKEEKQHVEHVEHIENIEDVKNEKENEVIEVKDDDIKVEKVYSERLAALKDITTSTFVDMDRLDVADNLGVPLAVATGGLSLGFTVANNVRLARVIAEATRFSHSLPENYDLKANSSMRILCLKFKEDPQPLQFTVNKLGQTYTFTY